MKVRILSALDNTVNSKYLCNFLLKKGSDLYKVFENTDTILFAGADLYKNVIIEINNIKIYLELLLKDIRNYSKFSYCGSDKLDLQLSDCEDLFFNYKWLIKQLKEAEFDYTVVNIKDFNISEFQLIHIL